MCCDFHSSCCNTISQYCVHRLTGIWLELEMKGSEGQRLALAQVETCGSGQIQVVAREQDQEIKDCAWES